MGLLAFGHTPKLYKIMSHAATEPIVGGKPGRYWHLLKDGRIQCDVCPRYCKLHEEQRGLCFVRARHNDEIVLTTYGRSARVLDRVQDLASPEAIAQAA